MRKSTSQNRNPSAVLEVICPNRAVIIIKITREMAGTTKTVTRRRGLGQFF
jgi:hypothetical protein